MKILKTLFLIVGIVVVLGASLAQTDDSTTFLVNATTIHTSRGYAHLIDHTALKFEWSSAEKFFNKYPFLSVCKIGKDTVIVNNVSFLDEIEIRIDTIPYNLLISELELKNSSVIHLSFINPRNRHVEFNLCKFHGDTHILFDTLNYLGFQENKRGTVHLFAHYIDNFFMDDNKFESIYVDAHIYSMAVVRDTTLRNINLGKSNITELSIGCMELDSYKNPVNRGFEIQAHGAESCAVEKLFLRGNFKDSSHFDVSNISIKHLYNSGMKFPDHFLFYNAKIDKVSGFGYREDWLSPKSIYIYNADLSNININFNKTKIEKCIYSQNRNGNIFNQSADDLNGLFQRRMEICRKKSQDDILYHLESQYHDFYYFEYRKGILNQISYYIQKWWWDFGYKKERVLRNTGIIYFLLIIINSFYIKTLSSKIYFIQDIRKRVKKSSLSWVQRVKYSFYYTSIVFFGLKLDIDSFKFSRFFGVVYIFIVYGIGIICLAFIANWIFSNLS